MMPASGGDASAIWNRSCPNRLSAMSLAVVGNLKQLPSAADGVDEIEIGAEQ
jgi:hypothetical protein